VNRVELETALNTGVQVEIDDLQELHYISHTENVASIVEDGLFSHSDASRFGHRTIDNQDVQQRRAGISVECAGDRPLHSYACLYLNARNPMMYRLRGQHDRLVVLRFGPLVIHEAGAVVADRNAARGDANFALLPDGFSIVDREATFACSWYDDDEDARRRNGAMTQAEVLVPILIEPEFILGAYVSTGAAALDLTARLPDLAVTVKPDMFFR
jgi:hypothetical protein